MLVQCACWQWCANGCNNSQQCWDLQCIMGRIQPISLCKPCVMSVRGPINVGRAVQTDPTLLRYTSAIAEQKKCWELLAEKLTGFKLCATASNSMQQGVQTDSTCNIQQCWELLANNVSSVCTGLKDYCQRAASQRQIEQRARMARWHLAIAIISRCKPANISCAFCNFKNVFYGWIK